MYSAKFKIFLHICQEIFLVTCQVFFNGWTGRCIPSEKQMDHTARPWPRCHHVKSIQTRSHGLGSTFLFREVCPSIIGWIFWEYPKGRGGVDYTLQAGCRIVSAQYATLFWRSSNGELWMPMDEIGGACTFDIVSKLQQLESVRPLALSPISAHHPSLPLTSDTWKRTQAIIIRICQKCMICRHSASKLCPNCAMAGPFSACILVPYAVGLYVGGLYTV